MNRYSALSLDASGPSASAFKHAMAAKKQGSPVTKPVTGSGTGTATVKTKTDPLTKDNFPSLAPVNKPSVARSSCWKTVDTIKAAASLPTPESKFKQSDNKLRVKTPPLDIDRYYNDPTYVAIMSKNGVFFVDQNGECPEDNIPSYLRDEVEGYNPNKGTIGYDSDDEF